MRLQKRFSRRYKNKNYYKYLINIPEEYIKKSDLKVGDNLEIEAERYKLMLKKAEKSWK